MAGRPSTSRRLGRLVVLPRRQFSQRSSDGSNSDVAETLLFPSSSSSMWSGPVSTNCPHQKNKRSRMALILKKTCKITFLFVLINALLKSGDDFVGRRRQLLCQRKLHKNHQYHPTASASSSVISVNAPGSDSINSSNSNDGFYPTDLIDRLLLQTSSSSDCETIYPTEVATEIGIDVYYAPPEPDSGMTFSEVAVIPEAELDSTTDTEFVDPVAIVPDVYAPKYYDVVDTTLLDSYEPTVYEPTNTTNRQETEVAYTVTILSCPNTYSPPESEVTNPGSDIYEASAIIKYNSCSSSESSSSSTSTPTERRTNRGLLRTKNDDRNNHHDLRHSRRQLLGEDESSSYTMYALVHPDAVNCENDDGTTYNRVKLLQDQGYYVEILGQPITNTDLVENQPYIAEHIEEDVGIRDSITLHAFNLEEHEAVVILDYNTQIQDSIQPEIEEFINDPTKEVEYVKDSDGGVSRGFMIIKPSKQKFHQYREMYLKTPYDPQTGWNGEGHNQSKGKLGLKGFFSYLASVDNGWYELDRCTYNNQLDEVCINQVDVNDSKVVRHSKNVCGEPRDCPYDHPLWSAKKKEACQKAHANYFKARHEFETKYFIKNKIQERFGQFKGKSFHGYCTGPGKNKYLGLVDRIKPKPDWQTVCDGLKVCPIGTYMKSDCTCTELDEDPCNACPSNTRCQRSPELMCIDCTCGFCDSQGLACCEFNGVNNCRAGPGSNHDCVMQKNFFPSFSGNGQVCSGVEISETATPNGCGCKPNDTLPCTYNEDLQGQYDDQCNICTTADIVDGKCLSCVDCLADCDSCITTANTVVSSKNCLKKMDDDCRAQCTSVCKK